MLSKIPGWAFAWSMGWLVFWFVVLISLGILVASQGNFSSADLLGFGVILLGGGGGGFTGGLLAGLFNMLALRPNAPSISWRHMSPTIRIWGVSGPLGMPVSGLIPAFMLAVGALTAQGAAPDCTGSLGDCVGQIIGSAVGGVIALVFITLFVFGVFVLAGWLSVRHIRRLEPGITTGQGWGVSAGWGCGAILAAMVMVVIVGLFSSLLGL